ncbi:UNVERIFIED_ORG: hypothetical protein FHW05_000250 [Pantoea agglomerans]
MIPKSIDELNEQLKGIEEEADSVDKFFSILRNSNLKARDLSSIINVKEYDEITKDYTPLHFYVSFERRREVLYILDSLYELNNETYEEFLEEGNDYVTKEQYLSDKKERLKYDQIDLLEIITRIISGDNARVTDSDTKFINGWQLQTPITTIDMKTIAFDNKMVGALRGGMDDENNNTILFKIISGSATGDDYKKLKEMPQGYGWPTYGLNQRVWAQIDINTPDEILMLAFSNWLKETRELPIFKNSGVPYHLFSEGVVKDIHFKKWHALRVLAYLDLKILSCLTETKVTMKNYADILYFDDFEKDTTEKVRKTLIPMVNEILGSGYLNNLLKKILAE